MHVDRVQTKQTRKRKVLAFRTVHHCCILLIETRWHASHIRYRSLIFLKTERTMVQVVVLAVCVANDAEPSPKNNKWALRSMTPLCSWMVVQRWHLAVDDMVLALLSGFDSVVVENFPPYGLDSYTSFEMMQRKKRRKTSMSKQMSKQRLQLDHQ